MRNIIANKIKGFTLIEVLIVVAIVGILAAIAYPSYVEQINKSRRADAQTALIELAARLQEYYIDQTPPGYAGAALGDAGIFPNQAPLEGNTKYYNLSITVQDNSSFTIQAMPIAGGAMANDVTFTLDETGNREHINGTTTEDGWPR
ncbi:MAG: hypothetical protein COC05_03630 [Gammaproteobacteria bacterium]|nr:MAG: hypothetical protein COC05_03630 [Gammaproteobacteria bacterium]